MLASAVLVLRGQVPAPSPEPPATTTEAIRAAVADPGLPVRDPVRTPRWRVYGAQRDAIDGVVAPQYLLYTRAQGERVELTVQNRNTGDDLLRHAVPHEGAPWASLLHNGLLLVAHGRQQVRLAAVDPVSREVRELAPPAGHSFRPRLVDLGDEVLLLGWDDALQRSCVLAVQPWTGAARVAWCAEQGTVPAWLYDGVDEATWPASTFPRACLQWQRLRSGGEVQPMPQNPLLCGARNVIDFDGWQVAQRAERDAPQPLIVASDGTNQLGLGTAGGFAGCGRHVYWSAATASVHPDTVYRWLPGTDYREVVYRLDSIRRHSLGVPRCTDGVLSIAVTTVGNSTRLVELRALNRP